MSTTNAHGQRIGRAVDWAPRPEPTGAVLEGKGVRLEPLAEGHVDGLFAAACREDDDALWTYLFWERPRAREEMAALVAALVGSGQAASGTAPYAIVAQETGQGVGFCSLMRIDPAMGSIEVGGIVFGRQLQRSRAATEAMYLLMTHVFDDLGYRRYEWKCDSLNDASRRAAIRLGFIWEGRFRNAVVYKGRNRDTDWFSITDHEWPRVRQALEDWLDDRNFDTAGRQRVRLAARPAEQSTQQEQ